MLSGSRDSKLSTDVTALPLLPTAMGSLWQDKSGVPLPCAKSLDHTKEMGSRLRVGATDCFKELGQKRRCLEVVSA